MQQSGYCLLRSRFWGRHATLLFLNGFFYSNHIVEEECCVTTDSENGCLDIQFRRPLQRFFFHNNFKQHPGTNIQEAVHSTDFQHTQLRSQYKTGKDNDGLHTYQVLRKLSSFLLLTKIQQAITKQRKSRKITPCKKCDGVVNFALPWNILEFLLRKSEVASWWRGYLYRFSYVMKDRVLWEGNIRHLSRLLLCNQLWTAEKWWRFSREV